MFLELFIHEINKNIVIQFQALSVLIIRNNLQRSTQKRQNNNTPGTAGGPAGRDRTLAVKNRKNIRKIIKKLKIFFCIYLLVMPKYWVKNYFAHRRFPEVGQKQKTEKKK